MLGLPRDASDAEIRRAYLRQARRTHPDVRGDSPEASEQMRRINQAWALLSGPRAGAADPAEPHSRPRSPAPEGNVRSPGGGGAGPQAADWPDNATGPEDGDWPEAAVESDDRPISAGRLPEWLRLGAPACFMVGVFALIAGAMTGILPVAAFGLLTLAGSALLFPLATFVVLVTSRRR